MKRIIALLIAVIIVCLIWSGGWIWASGYIRDNVAALENPANPADPKLVCAGLDVSGFPFRFDVTCRDMVLTQSDVTLELPELKATIRIYAPMHGLAFAQGPLTMRDAFTGSAQQLDWESLEASLRMNFTQLQRLSIVADNLVQTDLLFGETQSATADHAEIHLIGQPRDDMEDQTDLQGFVRLDNFAYPQLAIAPTNLKLDALAQHLPKDTITWFNANMLRNWQTADGALTINALTLDDATASANLSGTLSLSENGLPEGDLTLVTDNVGPRLDAFLNPQDQAIFLGPEQSDGSRKQTIIMRQGMALAGLVPLGQLQPLF